MSKNSPEKHPDGFVSIRVVPREIGKVIYADRWPAIAKRLRKRDDLSREYAAALKDGADAATVASISSRLSAAEAAVRPEWGRLLIEADRLITSDDLPLYHYRRGGLPYPVSKDRSTGDSDEHVRARRLMLQTGKLQRVENYDLSYLVKRGRQVDLRSLIRHSADSVTLVTDKDDVRPRPRSLGAKASDLVIVLERDLREALQRLREGLGEQQTADLPQSAPEGDKTTSPGRPSLRAEITDAYLALEREKSINFQAPKARLYEPIRKKVRKALGKPNLSQGLSGEVIRSTIAPLFEAGKAKQQSAST